MILIGIDPEPSGAWCIWDTTKKELKFFTSHEDPHDRENQFITDTPMVHWKVDHVCIEDAHVRPGMHATSMTKYVKSFGIWIGILYSSFDIYNKVKNPGGSTQLDIIHPARWKSKLGLSGQEKIGSYNLTKKIIQEEEFGLDYDEIMKQLKLSSTCDDKQIYDRCESFLIAYYGRLYCGPGTE
jgi:hypothetical protein